MYEEDEIEEDLPDVFAAVCTAHRRELKSPKQQQNQVRYI